MIRATTILLLVVCLTQWGLADILFTKKGETFSGQVESITTDEVVFRIPLGGFEYELREFLISEVLEILDDNGDPIPFNKPLESIAESDSTLGEAPITETVSYRFSLNRTYSRWPLLVGSVVFTTVGAFKLSKAATQYRDIERDEDLGYDVTDRKNEAAGNRLWGELAVAAGALCLVLAVTPEKVKKLVLESFYLRDDLSGVGWTITLP